MSAAVAVEVVSIRLQFAYLSLWRERTIAAMSCIHVISVEIIRVENKDWGVRWGSIREHVHNGRIANLMRKRSSKFVHAYSTSIKVVETCLFRQHYALWKYVLPDVILMSMFSEQLNFAYYAFLLCPPSRVVLI